MEDILARSIDVCMAAVKQRDPTAELLEAQGTGASTTVGSAELVINWVLLFVGQNRSGYRVTCDEGSVRSVESDPQSAYGDRPIQLPLQRSLSDAVEAMRSKGFTEPFTTARLRFPLYWSAKEPEYAFVLPSRRVAVTVGVVTGEVSEQPLSGNS